MKQTTWQGMVLMSLLLTTGIAGCGDNGAEVAEVEPEPEMVVEDPVHHEMHIEATTRGDDWVIIHIETTLPGAPQVMASVTMEGEGDYHIAHDSHRVSISGGKGETAFQVNEFPSGEYRVMASFYPRWGYGDRALPEGVDGEEPIVGGPQMVQVVGSGEPAHEYAERQEAKRWVMNNVNLGYTWNADSWRQRFGDWEEFPATKRNPDIIKNYYFPYLEKTIVVNVLKQEIVAWFRGRQGL